MSWNIHSCVLKPTVYVSFVYMQPWLVYCTAWCIISLTPVRCFGDGSGSRTIRPSIYQQIGTTIDWFDSCLRFRTEARAGGRSAEVTRSGVRLIGKGWPCASESSGKGIHHRHCTCFFLLAVICVTVQRCGREEAWGSWIMRGLYREDRLPQQHLCQSLWMVHRACDAAQWQQETLTACGWRRVWGNLTTDYWVFSHEVVSEV